MFRRLLLPLVLFTLASVGCCHCQSGRVYRGGCGPLGGLFACGSGCGNTYVGEWYSDPPSCDPCDDCGNWTGNCRGGCCRPFCLSNLWWGVIGVRGDCGSCCGGGSCGGCAGGSCGGCDSCGGGYADGGYSDGGYIDGGYQGDVIHEQRPQPAPPRPGMNQQTKSPSRSVLQDPSRMPPQGGSGPSSAPVGRKPQGTRTTKVQKKPAPVRLTSYEDDASAEAAASQTITHRAKVIR